MSNENVYTITESGFGFTILINGNTLTDAAVRPRFFSTRSSARKAISRLRRSITS